MVPRVSMTSYDITVATRDDAMAILWLLMAVPLHAMTVHDVAVATHGVTRGVAMGGRGDATEHLSLL